MKKIVFVIANPAKNELTGWDIGFWLSELAQPYNAFSQKGYTMTFASPKGGKVVYDAISDPEGPGARHVDLVTTGFKHHPATKALLENTVPLSSIRVEDYDGIFVIGGLSPMYTFIDNKPLHELFARFYEQGKVAATICHGSCILLKTKTASGKLLAEGKKWTGFCNTEEDVVDKMAGKKVEPFRIEDEARKLNTNYVKGGTYQPFAVADGNLISGQQGSSGAATAELVIAYFANHP